MLEYDITARFSSSEVAVHDFFDFATLRSHAAHLHYQKSFDINQNLQFDIHGIIG
jgi:hypothetical protein